MKRHVLFFAVILFFGIFNLLAITSLLPQTDELPGWSLSGKTRQVEGEDLFLLINGGAEIYHEYGFKQAVTGMYKKGNKTVNLEIYEMKNPAAAYGVYTFKTGERGQELPIGNDAKLEDYYLNSWKGCFQVTLVGFDSEQETLDGLMTIARVINGKIKNSGKKPGLTGLLLKKNLNESTVKYLGGNLGLFNHYEFASRDIFAVTEGVIGDYGKFKVFILKYADRRESLNRFKNAANYLENSHRFKHFALHQAAFSMTDRKGKPLYIEIYNRFILILLGKEKEEAEFILRKMTGAWKK